jgi:hypothetical protein
MVEEYLESIEIEKNIKTLIYFLAFLHLRVKNGNYIFLFQIRTYGSSGEAP